MTKKDFELIANVLYQAKVEGLQVEEIIERFAEVLKGRNIKFNTEKFFKACGVIE